MILGLGCDMVDIRRFERTLTRFPGRFEERCFTEIEQRKSDRRANRAASYAKRFAAKEACSKALGTGFRDGVFWRDLGVVNLARSEEHTSELQSLMRISYAVFCLKKKKSSQANTITSPQTTKK